MDIVHMFSSKKRQDLNLVIDVEKENLMENRKELEDYIFTKSFIKTFRNFFGIYKGWILEDTSMASILLTGIEGSGKSHFLKVVSSIIENKVVDSENTIDYLAKSGKFFDGFLTADITLASHSQSDLIMLNGEKIEGQNLTEKLFDEIKEIYKDIDTDTDENNLEIDISQEERLAREIMKYIQTKGPNHRLVLIVDNLDKLVEKDENSLSDFLKLMKKLDAICKNKIFFIGSASKKINEIEKASSEQKEDLSNIFQNITIENTNIDELIKLRLLVKNQLAIEHLRKLYKENSDDINKLLFSTREGGRYRYINEDEFIATFPMIPFQYDIIFKIILEMKEEGLLEDSFTYSTRNLLEIFQQAIFSEKKSNTNNSIIRITRFYDILEKNFANDKEFSIINASNNSNLSQIDLDVLKTLFLVKQIEAKGVDVENLTTMLITDLKQNRDEFKEEVNESLNTLFRENYISKVEENYIYLTTEELEVFDEIEKTPVTEEEIYDELSETLKNIEVLNLNYKYKDRYLTNFMHMVDNKYILGNKDSEFQLLMITSLNPKKSEIDLLQSSIDNDNIVIRLNEDEKLLQEIKHLIRTKKLVEVKNGNKSKEIDSLVDLKEKEINLLSDEIEKQFLKLIEEAEIFVVGESLKKENLNFQEKIEYAMDKLIERKYSKLNYMESKPSIDDIILLLKNSQDQLELDELPNKKALEEISRALEEKLKTKKRVSLEELVEYFKLPPYGYIDNDVLWAIANLYKLDEIRLISSNQPIIINEDTSYSEIETILKDHDLKPLQIEVKEKISIESIDSISYLIKEMYEIETSDNDADKLMNIFVTSSNKLKSNLQEILSENHDMDFRYFGRQEIEAYIEGLENINNSDNTFDFFRKIEKNKNDLIDSNIKIRGLLNFYNGDQKDILKKAFELTDKVFVLNLDQDKDISESIEDIDNLIKDNTIENIEELKVVLEKYESQYDSYIQEKLIKLKKQSIKDKEEILDKANKEDILSNHIPIIEVNYKEFIESIDDINTLEELTYKQNQAKILKVGYLNKIKSYISLEANKIITSKSLDLDSITNGEILVIKDKDDIDDFLDKIKEQILSEKENIDILYIR